MLFKKFLSFFFAAKTEAKLQNEIDAIIAPINKIVAKLDRYVEAKDEEVLRQTKELEALGAKIKANEIAAARAINLGARYRNLTDVSDAVAGAFPAE